MDSAQRRLGLHSIYGTWGSLWTEEKQKAATREQTVKYGSKWIGHMVTDCSGLVRWALKQLGQDMVHHATYQYTDQCAPKGRLIEGRRSDGNPLLPGSLVFLQGNQDKIHHVGVYVGEGIVIEAKGTQAGVVTSKLDKWDHWGQLKSVDYTNAGEMENIVPEQSRNDVLYKAEVTNPNRWLNVRSGPGTNYPLQFQLEKGTIVDVLAESNGWDQVRSGGRIGWASGEYLTPLSEEEQPEEPIPPEDDTEAPDDGVEVRPSVMEELENVLQTLSGLEKKVASIIRRL